jgi:hypothetical protein
MSEPSEIRGVQYSLDTAITQHLALEIHRQSRAGRNSYFVRLCPASDTRSVWCTLCCAFISQGKKKRFDQDSLNISSHYKDRVGMPHSIAAQSCAWGGSTNSSRARYTPAQTSTNNVRMPPGTKDRLNQPGQLRCVRREAISRFREGIPAVRREPIARRHERPDNCSAFSEVRSTATKISSSFRVPIRRDNIVFLGDVWVVDQADSKQHPTSHASRYWPCPAMRLHSFISTTP